MAQPKPLQAHHGPLCSQRLPQLLSTASQCGNPPPIGLTEDIQSIRDELTKLVEIEKRDVIVAAHSYAGLVTTQGVTAEFSKAREAKGLAGGVVHLVFMCAFIVPLGESLESALGGLLPPSFEVDVSIYLQEPLEIYDMLTSR